LELGLLLLEEVGFDLGTLTLGA
jgi:hypothetical protein